MKRDKTGGRKKGTPNKITTELREWIMDFLQKNKSQIETDWKQLDPKDRIQLFEKLLKFALPTLQSVSGNIEFDRMTDAELDAIIERLKQGSYEP